MHDLLVLGLALSLFLLPCFLAYRVKDRDIHH